MSSDDVDDDINLTCPITHELFRDPVRANDGYVYERQAIIRWINEKGTSPFTRQPLNIDQLQPDEEIKTRANHRRIFLLTNNPNSEQIQSSSSIYRSNRVVDVTDNRERTHCCSCYRNGRCICPNIRSCLGACRDSIIEKFSTCSSCLSRCAPVVIVLCCVACITVATVVPIVFLYSEKQTTRVGTPRMLSYNRYISYPTVCQSLNQSMSIIFRKIHHFSSTISFFLAFLTNTCTLSFTNITVLDYVTCTNFSYQYIDYTFKAISSYSTIIFAFEQTSGYWDIDNITLWDIAANQEIFQNGDFESGSLIPHYTTCQSSGFISNTSQFNGSYCFSDHTTGQYGYLMQTIPTNITAWYIVLFYLQNRNGPGSNYAILLGS